MLSRLANVLHITPAERAALQLLAIGKPAREIALRLGVIESEVDRELSALFRRMGARSRAEAVATANRRGLLSSDARHPPKDSGPAAAATTQGAKP
jgi:DNA-binding NarL/FixJ family response regulator